MKIVTVDCLVMLEGEYRGHYTWKEGSSVPIFEDALRVGSIIQVIDIANRERKVYEVAYLKSYLEKCADNKEVPNTKCYQGTEVGLNEVTHLEEY